MGNKQNGDLSASGVLLTILLGISVAKILDVLLESSDDFLWLWLSIISLGLAIILVLELIDFKKAKTNFNEGMRILVTFLVIFFPYTILKLLPLEDKTGNDFIWNFGWEIIYSIILGTSFILLGSSEDKENKIKYIAPIVAGIIIIIISITLYALRGYIGIK